MKTDELLYEMMSEVSEKEAEVLDGLMQDGVMPDKENNYQGRFEKRKQNNWERQEKLSLDKIKKEMQKNNRKQVRLFNRHRIVLFAAVMVMMLGVAAFARENDWDIEMAEQIGLSGAMEKLEGGYVRIDNSATQDGITITAVQSIGDQNSQWIQFDTDIPWMVGKEGYYMFEDMRAYFIDGNGRIITGGMHFYSYNNNGNVSFLLYAMGYEKINRADVKIEFKKIRQYENPESEGILVSEGQWEFEWNNYYSANTITKHPYSVADGLLIYKVELSPVSIRIEAAGIPFEKYNSLTVESVTLQDGRVIACQEDLVRGSTNNTFFDSYVIYEDMESIDVEQVKSVTVNGKEIKLY